MQKMTIRKHANRHMTAKGFGTVRLKHIHAHVKAGGEIGTTGERANAKEILFSAAMKHGGLVSRKMTKKELIKAIRES